MGVPLRGGGICALVSSVICAEIERLIFLESDGPKLRPSATRPVNKLNWICVTIMG